jgi:hypothetical protein
VIKRGLAQAGRREHPKDLAMIIDTNHRTTSHLSSLAEKGLTAIIRYYARYSSRRRGWT